MMQKLIILYLINSKFDVLLTKMYIYIKITKCTTFVTLLNLRIAADSNMLRSGFRKFREVQIHLVNLFCSKNLEITVGKSKTLIPFQEGFSLTLHICNIT